MDSDATREIPSPKPKRKLNQLAAEGDDRIRTCQPGLLTRVLRPLAPGIPTFNMFPAVVGVILRGGCTWVVRVRGLSLAYD